MEMKLNPQVLLWAVKRSGLTEAQIAREFPKFPQWIEGTWEPTPKQIRSFAAKTHVSVFELFSDHLPDYGLQIADFRTVDGNGAQNPSPELFDTVRSMLERQDWLRGYFLHEGYGRVEFVGSFMEQPRDDKAVHALANALHSLLGLDETWAQRYRTVEDALRTLKGAAERERISVTINGVVGDNTHRKLDVSEFRGFCLADDLAPMIFINGRDAKSAQIFTLVHELCHLAYAKSGVSNVPEDKEDAPSLELEKFCNAAAAEFLVPSALLEDEWQSAREPAFERVRRIAAAHKVNFVVVARSLKDLELISLDDFFGLYHDYQSRQPEGRPASKGGGDYFLNKRYKLGAVFGDAVWSAVNTNYLSYRDAYELTGMTAPSFKHYFEEVA